MIAKIGYFDLYAIQAPPPLNFGPPPEIDFSMFQMIWSRKKIFFWYKKIFGLRKFFGFFFFFFANFFFSCSIIMNANPTL